ncbi:MAG: hypothetical protein AAF821_12500 [Cyanobacteria bacterium P01_D01_bin.156]
MTPQDIFYQLQTRFGADCLTVPAEDTWQIDTPELRLLVVVSQNQTWLQMLIPIVPLAEAQPFLKEILAANFEQTQTARYAIYEDALWGVFQHCLETLDPMDFSVALEQLLSMKATGVSSFFNDVIETRIRQLIIAAKLRGQSLEATMQTISRFYAEGMMGDMQDSNYGERALGAWQKQLERLWPEVNPPQTAANND